jgi:hypothetical protein
LPQNAEPPSNAPKVRHALVRRLARELFLANGRSAAETAAQSELSSEEQEALSRELNRIEMAVRDFLAQLPSKPDDTYGG